MSNTTRQKYKVIALIPARSGSKRIEKKNIKLLSGHPLIAYTIAVARESGIFSRTIISTDDEEIAQIARYYGGEVPFLRPKKYSQDNSPDIEWVKYTLSQIKKKEGLEYDIFSILRPTSPFRKIETISRAWNIFMQKKAHSLRAVEKCRQHPAKMWKLSRGKMKPIIYNPNRKGIPWHSKPYQTLPEIYTQNASLEIAWSYLPLKHSSISGHIIIPFITDGNEGYDINHEKDWIYAEYLINKGEVLLPDIKHKPYKKY